MPGALEDTEEETTTEKEVIPDRDNFTSTLSRLNLWPDFFKNHLGNTLEGHVNLRTNLSQSTRRVGALLLSMADR